MRKSRAITLTVLAGLMLTGCCLTTVGCGGRRHAPPPDHTWYDASGNAIPEKWKADEQGNRVLDANGRPIPDPDVPRDRYGRPWVYENGVWTPPPSPAGAYSSSSSSSSSSHSYSSHPGVWIWGGSGYRSTGGTSYRPAAGVGSSSSSASRSSGPSSISRGGFGSTGSSASSSSSS